MIRRTPSGASEMSLMSYRLVAAMNLLSSWSDPRTCPLGGQEPLVLALLPVDPGAGVGGGCEPAVHRLSQLRLTAQARDERELVELDAKPPPQLTERAQLVQIAEAVDAIAGGSAPRYDEPLPLEVAQHARRPAAT